MKNNFAKLMLRTFGWKIENAAVMPQKCVICVAPHTTNWDFMVGVLYKSAMKVKANFFIKKEWFSFPFGGLMNSLGGVPVDRSKKTSLTDQMAEVFKKRDEFRVAIAPEGTRKAIAEWKKGFYFIALKAEVPIVLAYIDYKKKTVGIGKIIDATGDIDVDMTKIKTYYKDINAKFPNNFICEL